MEIGKDATGNIGNLRPPRLEDAGLEDCALPPDAINEAFLKAAEAVRSRDGDDDCVMNPVTDPYHQSCSGEKCTVGVSEVATESCVDGLRGLEIAEKKHDEEDERLSESLEK